MPDAAPSRLHGALRCSFANNVRGSPGYSRFMLAQDLELIALIDRAQASGATSATALMEGFVYGNLKIEYPSLERETVVAVVRDYLRER
jgi:hypothetical protein